MLVGGSLYVAGRLISYVRNRRSGANAPPPQPPQQQPQQLRQEPPQQQAAIAAQANQAAASKRWRTTMLDLMLVVFVLAFVILVLLQERAVLVAAPGLFLFLRYLLYTSPFEVSHEGVPGAPLPAPRAQQLQPSRPLLLQAPAEFKEGLEEKELERITLPQEARNQWEFPDEVKSNALFLLIPFKFEYEFKHPWERVLEKAKSRYPDPLKPATIMTKVRDDEAEVILPHSGQKVKCRFIHFETRIPSKVPDFLRRMLGSQAIPDHFVLEDKYIELPQKRFARIQTVNQNVRGVAVVMIMSEYRVHSREHVDWTILEQYMAVQFVSGNFFRGQLQGFAERTFKSEALDEAQKLDRALSQ